MARTSSVGVSRRPPGAVAVGATPESRRGRLGGDATEKSPPPEAPAIAARASRPARDLAESLSAFANIDFQAERDMLENAGAFRARSRLPTRARARPSSPSRTFLSTTPFLSLISLVPPPVFPQARTPPARLAPPPCRSLIRDASSATSPTRRARPPPRARARREALHPPPSSLPRRSTDGASTPTRPSLPCGGDGTRVHAPKSPAEELAHRAALAAAKIAAAAPPVPPTTPRTPPPPRPNAPRRSGSGSGSASGSERSKISSAERAKRMASHAERAYDDPGIVDGEHYRALVRRG